jgi:hypothetical protein
MSKPNAPVDGALSSGSKRSSRSVRNDHRLNTVGKLLERQME